MAANRPRKDSARLVWGSKPKRPLALRDLELRTTEIVIPNAQDSQSHFAKEHMNRLICGDNGLAMQALLTQNYAGKIDLIYVDPPFASCDNYALGITIDGIKIEKSASRLERLAYTDTWETEIDAYLDFIYPRLQLMKKLLSDSGSIYVHLDWHICHYVKVLMDEIFGYDNFQNEIIWYYYNKFQGNINRFASNHDTILCYRNGKKYIFNKQTEKREKPVRQIKRTWDKEKGAIVNAKDELGKVIYRETDRRTVDDVWRISMLQPADKKENLSYPTQKPEALLERIIKASSDEGDLVADFFCGSGTAMAVAERLGRCWIGCNLDKVGVQISRNRLVNQQAQPFVLQTVSHYQRQMIYLVGGRISEMQRTILKLYGAVPQPERSDLGMCWRGGIPELVYVGYPDRPVTARKVWLLLQQMQGLEEVDCKNLAILAWDYDENYVAELADRTRTMKSSLATTIQSLMIPSEIFNYLKQSAQDVNLKYLRDKIVFREIPDLRLRQTVRQVEQDKVIIALAIERYALKTCPVPVEYQGALSDAIANNPATVIDSWAVDWNYDGTTFRSMWHAIRGYGKGARTVVAIAESPELPAGQRRVAVRVVDIFGNETNTTLQVEKVKK